jgi:hypothetical protein
LMPVLQRSGLLAPRENRRRKRRSPLRWAPVEMTNLLRPFGSVHSAKEVAMKDNAASVTNLSRPE